MIRAEIVWISWAAFFAVQCIKTCKVFLRQILIQGADSLGVEKLLIKMISRHVREFEKIC